MDKISTLNLFSIAFGYSLNVYPRQNTTAYVPLDSGYNNVDSISSLDVKKSIFGTPIFQPVKLDGFDLPNEPVVEINGTKRIVKTEIDNQDGTFKELFSRDDYAITIRGIVVQEDGTDNYPEDIVRRIRDICEKKTSVGVTCEMINLFGVDLIAIESYSFPAMEGFPGAQPFIIQASSDKILDINLSNG